MQNARPPYLSFTLLVLYLFIVSCNYADTTVKKNKEVVDSPQEMNSKTSENIKETLAFALKEGGKVDDSIRLHMAAIVQYFYTATNNQPVWSSKEQWQPYTDSLYQLIANAELNGLFPKDYHFGFLKSLKHSLDTDSLKRMDAVLWTKADLMFTDALMRMVKDLKLGRLQPDSVTINKDSSVKEDFFVNSLNTAIKKNGFTELFNSLQPLHKGYWELKRGVKRFLDSMDRRTYTYVYYPYKNGDQKDSLAFIKTFQKRLVESGAINFSNKLSDSFELATAVKKYQLQRGLKQDGKITTSLVKLMNTSDMERFKRIAITLDRYKQLPAKMPEKYIWVNLPAYYLWVIDNDTVAIESKVICGKPDTRTPLLNSAITDMVTYPTWTIPNSIILKTLLPKLKSNPGYLDRLGYKLLGSGGKVIDPYEVKWDKYKKGIPYRIQQGSGDNNALGIFKFNFNNPYAVYLHDTNQRYLFKNSSRALSHGCVRVQEWQKLAYFIARNDSVNTKISDTLRYNTDSIKNWIANKQFRKMEVKNRIPVFIRYFTCEGKNGKIKFYEDIYGEDKILREKYFSGK
jgi:L,D-transpeptidase YcbB